MPGALVWLPVFAECVTDTLEASVGPTWRLPWAPAHHTLPRNVQNPRTSLAMETTLPVNSVKSCLLPTSPRSALSIAKAFQVPDPLQRPWVLCKAACLALNLVKPGLRPCMTSDPFTFNPDPILLPSIFSGQRGTSLKLLPGPPDKEA